LNPVTVKFNEPAFQMMFWPTVTEEPGGSGDQVITGGADGSGQEIAAATEAAPAGGVGAPDDLASCPELLLGSTPGSTQVVDPAQAYWKFPPSTATVQVSVVSEGFLISWQGESVRNFTVTGWLA
jgi:hypothetical protein